MGLPGSVLCPPEQAAEGGEEHVFVGVPDVALLAVIGFGGVFAEGDRHQPFESFVAEAGEYDGGEGVLECPGFCGGDLDEGRGEAEAVGEVDEAVELVAAPAELGVERMAC